MATLILDDFTSGPYLKTLIAPGAIDYNFQPLGGGPLGRWRQTVFQQGDANAWGQPCTLDIRTPVGPLSGILLVDAGFDTDGSVGLLYGNTPLNGDTSPGSKNVQGPPAPLGLNLIAPPVPYTAFQLVFAGLATSDAGTPVTISVASAGIFWDQTISPGPSDNTFTLVFPFSKFKNGVVSAPQSVFSDISAIDIGVGALPSSSWGLTSLQATT
jgi:hypothetical protein